MNGIKYWVMQGSVYLDAVMRIYYKSIVWSLARITTIIRFPARIVSTILYIFQGNM